jgi:hypothetical protein
MIILTYSLLGLAQVYCSENILEKILIKKFQITNSRDTKNFDKLKPILSRKVRFIDQVKGIEKRQVNK